MNQKQSWKIRIGDFFFKYRAVSPIPFILILFFFFTPRDLGESNILVNLIGFAVVILGLSTRIIAVGYSHMGTSGRENFLRAENLNHDGIYSMTRNPLYLGNFLVYNGLLIVFASPWAFIPFNIYLVVLYTFIIHSEENYLKGQYGEKFLEYMKRTPRFVPGFSNFRKPENRFSLKKVLFKEKNSVYYSMTFFMIIMIYKEYLLNAGVIEKTQILIYAGIALFCINILLVVLKGRHFPHS